MKRIEQTWQMYGMEVTCRWTREDLPEGKCRIQGSWHCEPYGTRRIRVQVKSGTDGELYLKRQIERQLMESLRQEREEMPAQVSGKDPTLMELYRQKYRQYFNSHDWEPSTMDKYDRDYRCRLLCGNLEEKGARQITEEDIEKRMEKLAQQRQKLQPFEKSRQMKRMQDLWTLLCRFLEFLVREGDLDRNPVPEQKRQSLNIGNEKLEPSAREMYNRRFSKQSLTRQEAARLLTEAETGEEPLTLGCELMLTLGLRNGEACGLNYDCIKTTGEGSRAVALITVECQDEKDKHKKANRSITDRLKTKNAYRQLPCIPELEQRIQHQQQEIGNRHPEKSEAQLGKMPLLWVQTQKGRKNPVPDERRATAKDVSGIGRAMLDACLDAHGKPILVNELDEDLAGEEPGREENLTAYVLRHTYCTWLSIATDLTDEEIAYCMGHRSPTGKRLVMNEDVLRRLWKAHRTYWASFEAEATPPEDFLKEYYDRVGNTSE